jgi:hypothetical protein
VPFQLPSATSGLVPSEKLPVNDSPSSESANLPPLTVPLISPSLPSPA